MTTGNSSPLALCTVISRTPSLLSSRIGASALSDSAAARSSSMNPRNEMPPPASYCRASSATCSTLASACSPAGRRMKPTWARVSASSRADRVGHGPVVAGAVQLLQQPQRVGDRQQMRRRLAGERKLVAGVAAELLRNPERVDGPNRCRNSSRCSSSMAKSEPFSVAKTDSSSSGHSIAASAARMVSTSSRPWNALPPTSRCGMPRASIASVYARVTSLPKLTNRRNSTAMCRG